MTVRDAIRGIDPQLPIYRLTTLETLLADSIAAPRFHTALLGGLALLALLLAAIGIYSVMAYDVGRRTREIGIRRRSHLPGYRRDLGRSRPGASSHPGGTAQPLSRPPRLLFLG